MSDTVRTVKNSTCRVMSILHLTDKKLSWAAKGMLSALLAFSGEYAINEIIQLTSNGKLAGEKVFAELEEYGYLKIAPHGTEMQFTVYEKPVIRGYPQHPESEIPYAEDIPGKTLLSKNMEEEDQTGLRERLNLEIAAKKCSENFVELVFRELCRRDADFCQLMTAKAFEIVCQTAWEKQRHTPNGEVSALINRYLDNVVLGIRAAGGGNERSEMIDFSLPCGYDKSRQ